MACRIHATSDSSTTTEPWQAKTNFTSKGKLIQYQEEGKGTTGVCVCSGVCLSDVAHMGEAMWKWMGVYWSESVWHPSGVSICHHLPSRLRTHECIFLSAASGAWMRISYWTKSLFAVSPSPHFFSFSCEKASCYYYESNGGCSFLAQESGPAERASNAQKMKMSGKLSSFLWSTLTLLAICIWP